MPLSKLECVAKWKPVLEQAGYGEITDPRKLEIVAQLIENTAEASLTTRSKSIMRDIGLLTEDDNPQSNIVANGSTGSMKSYDPILISMVRRTMPNLIAYDVCGVQPMNGPTGLVFTLRPKYITGAQGSDPNAGVDAFYNEPDTDFSGAGTHAGSDPTGAGYTTGGGMSTSVLEKLGSSDGTAWKEMGITMDKVTVTATGRALKAEFTTELAHDLMKLHGVSAHAELTNLLTGEILAEINREVVRKILWSAKSGAQNLDVTTAGTFDLNLDSNGRWAAEKFKGLLFQIEREANQIAIETRRGRGNLLICSPDVASALSLAGVLDHSPALNTGLDVDPAGNTFVGVLQGRYKVFIDPYFVASGTSASDYANFFVVGYKGSSQYDAGFFYCPYVPLESFEARGPDNFQPKIGFKTRYALAVNPFAKGTTLPASDGQPEANTNVYYRRVRVLKLTGKATVA